MNASIHVAIACHNRAAIAAQCLPTMAATITSNDALALYNDGSSEYDGHWLEQFQPEKGVGIITNSDEPLGIQAQRRLHFKHFLNIAMGATHIYLTDHDCFHDPDWRQQALRLQSAAGGAPLCLYNTAAHADMVGNTILDDSGSEIIWRHFAPGVSYFLTRAHVEKLVPFLPGLQHFDWQIPSILGSRFAVSRVSYLDHLGDGGERHPPGAGLDGGDRALSPSSWLVAKRKEIIAALSHAT